MLSVLYLQFYKLYTFILRLLPFLFSCICSTSFSSNPTLLSFFFFVFFLFLFFFKIFVLSFDFTSGYAYVLASPYVRARQKARETLKPEPFDQRH